MAELKPVIGTTWTRLHSEEYNVLFHVSYKLKLLLRLWRSYRGWVLVENLFKWIYHWHLKNINLFSFSFFFNSKSRKRKVAKTITRPRKSCTFTYCLEQKFFPLIPLEGILILLSETCLLQHCQIILTKINPFLLNFILQIIS